MGTSKKNKLSTAKKRSDGRAGPRICVSGTPKERRSTAERSLVEIWPQRAQHSGCFEET
jgi:hypothetical protein